ncbi:phosphate signaling complex protein PhoU [Caldalkalibacillus salinus]|uniref:phosphate signaling complex protein PhoU n=1 Tax=Caldalkalibacillus salinus TaxID=2803787 RepID=UPI001924FE79|nr:phosphate signaling complex protein PhoU [Caldalkalibacillus salinus]
MSVIRSHFETGLRELKDLLLQMGERTEQALDQSITALKEQDVVLAEKIIDQDIKINRLEEEINEKAILMIATQSPVASDLRRIIAALKISSDVERIGDYAVNIAKSVQMIGQKPLIKPLVDIPEMASISQTMLTQSLQAYYDEDLQLAKDVAETDDKVDTMYGITVQELLVLMSHNADAIEQITQLAFVCRYLERTADHCTNISESIIYLINGKRYDLND